MKKVLSFVFVLIIISALFVTPFNAEKQYVIDEAGVLSVEETQDLTTKIGNLREKYNMDFVILTVTSLGSENQVSFSDDYYDNNGYAEDGSLLLIRTLDRKGYISTSGYGITAFTDYGINYISSEIKKDIKEQKYYKAFDKYIKLCDEFVAEAKNGKPYDTNHKRKGMLDYAKAILISLGIGLVIAILAALSIKKKYKPVRLKAEANDYLVKDSLAVHNAYDNFLYTHVSRTRRSDDDNGGGSSTHTSSSGSTHGGGGFSW